jgi:hypothetical protein
VAHEEFEKGEFLWAKFDGVTAALYGVSDAIDLEISDFEHGAAGAAAAAENGADAGRKLGKGEGLRQTPPAARHLQRQECASADTGR